MARRSRYLHYDERVNALMKSRGDGRRKQDKETPAINGQVAVMRLLSALLFVCREMAAIGSARPVGAQPVRRTVLGGLGDAHQQAESFFCTKGHCLPILALQH